MNITTKFNIGDRVQYGPKGYNGEVATIKGIKQEEGRPVDYLVEWNDDSGETTYPQAQMDDLYHRTYRVLVVMNEYRNVWVNATSEDEARHLVERDDWYDGDVFPVENQTLDSEFDRIVDVDVTS
jgi:hypothetical protein